MVVGDPFWVTSHAIGFEEPTLPLRRSVASTALAGNVR
jgi:hypothetical protein